MKIKNKIITMLLCLLLLLFSAQERTYAAEVAQSDDLVVTEENFPDPNFRDYLKTLPGGEDLIFKPEELKKITVIACAGDGKSNKKIKSLKGIELFTYLTYLDVENQALTELDLSQNNNLEEVYCKNNRLTKLLLTSEHLSNLDCSNNRLRSLEVHSNKLAWLECSHNKLTSLVIDSNVVFDIDCSNNQLEELYLPSTKLTRISCANNHLESLELDSKNVEIIEAYNNKLESFDVSKYPNLELLNVNANFIDELDTSQNKSLKDIYYAPKEIKMDKRKNFELKDIPTFIKYITTNEDEIRIKTDHLVYNKELQTISVTEDSDYGYLTIQFENEDRGSYSYLFYYGNNPNKNSMMKTMGGSIILVSGMIIVGVIAFISYKQKH